MKRLNISNPKKDAKLVLAIIEQVLEQKRREHPDFEIAFTIKAKDGSLLLEL